MDKALVPPPPGAAEASEPPPLATAPSQPPAPYSIYPSWQRKLLVAGVSLTAFFSPLAAQIYLPAIPSLTKDLGITNTQVNLTITTYMILQGITPMFVGSLSDAGGRRPAYLACFVVFLAANVGLALAPNYGAILGLRCLQSAGSSSTVALCSAVVADVATSAERGQFVGFTVFPAVLAPALGPVVGGLLAQSLGWRWMFWFLVILSGVALVFLIVFLPETCRPIVGNGAIPPPRIYLTVWQLWTASRKSRARCQDPERQSIRSSTSIHKFHFKPPNMLGSLLILFEKDVAQVLIANSLVFSGFYCITTAMPSQFQERYQYNEIEVGLMYLPIAAGSLIATLFIGTLIDGNYRRHCRKLNLPLDRTRQADLSRFPIERARLEIGIPLLLLASVSIVTWGWAMHANTSAAAPGVISAFMGIGMVGFSNTTNVLLVDVNLGRAGMAIAASNIARCLLGAGATAAIVPLIDAVGVGWAFTLVGGLCFACTPCLLLLDRKGMGWRAEKAAKQEKKSQDEERERVT